jgi:hypothetical protein
VISRAFSFFLLHNHIIKKKSFSGEVKDSVIFPFYFLLHERAKPILPPCLPSHPPARTQTLLRKGMGTKLHRMKCLRTSEHIYIQRHTHHAHHCQSSGSGRIHCGVEVTELSTNKQHTLSPFFCFRLSLLLLAWFSFSTEDGFAHVLKTFRCSVLFCWSCSAPNNPIFSCLNYTFTFLSSLFVQAYPQKGRWSLLVFRELNFSSAWEEPLLLIPRVTALPRVEIAEPAVLSTLVTCTSQLF